VHNRHANSEASQPKPSGRSVATRSHTKKRKGTQKGPEWPTAKAPTSSTSRPRLARRPPPPCRSLPPSSNPSSSTRERGPRGGRPRSARCGAAACRGASARPRPPPRPPGSSPRARYLLASTVVLAPRRFVGVQCPHRFCSGYFCVF
jgi:hypothetical protein